MLTSVVWLNPLMTEHFLLPLAVWLLPSKPTNQPQRLHDWLNSINPRESRWKNTFIDRFLTLWPHNRHSSRYKLLHPSALGLFNVVLIRRQFILMSKSSLSRTVWRTIIAFCHRFLSLLIVLERKTFNPATTISVIPERYMIKLSCESYSALDGYFLLVLCTFRSTPVLWFYYNFTSRSETLKGTGDGGPR